MSDGDKPTHLDLFSGIGGFSLAFESVGFRTIGFSEIDAYASAVLKKHWPAIPNYGDIRNVRGITADIVTGGFPCQPFSLAGKRRGAADDRHLWPEMLRVISEARPAWVLGENAPGIIGMELDNCISDLESIGYSVQPFVVPACAVGADHERMRVWIIAHLNSEWKLQPQRIIQDERGRPSNSSYATAANLNSPRLQGRGKTGENSKDAAGIISRNGPRNQLASYVSKDYWNYQPVLGRGIHGIPNRLDRIRCLGNAIVPQVAQIFAQAIYQQLIEEV